jgi:hypothetical protein
MFMCRGRHLSELEHFIVWWLIECGWSKSKVARYLSVYVRSVQEHYAYAQFQLAADAQWFADKLVAYNVFELTQAADEEYNLLQAYNDYYAAHIQLLIDLHATTKQLI